MVEARNVRNDSLVLVLLWYEARNGLYSCRKSVLVRIALLGSCLLAYGIADIAATLHSHAAVLRQPLWSAKLGGAELLLGLLSGVALAGVSASRAFSPFLRALPLSIGARRRTSLIGALAALAPLGVLAGAAAAGACLVIEKPYPALWGATAGLLFGAGFVAGAIARLAYAFRAPDSRLPDTQPQWTGIRDPQLRWLDRANPAWLGSWAWNLNAGQIQLTARSAAALIILGIVTSMSMAASLAQHHAAPAALTAVSGGLLAFMLSLRCFPLASPVLRTAPLGFTHAWLRLLRLPAVLSVLFFALPSGAALAAEPGSWPAVAGGGFELLVLNTAYAIFAAYFATAPLSAAISFIVAVVYAAYEWLEYGQSILLAFAALIALLWHRARWRYYHG